MIVPSAFLALFGTTVAAFLLLRVWTSVKVGFIRLRWVTYNRTSDALLFWGMMMLCAIGSAMCLGVALFSAVVFAGSF